jgi:hypothetical protein
MAELEPAGPRRPMRFFGITRLGDGWV